MAITLINSANSFVRFGEDVPSTCLWGDIDFCLPMYAQDDVYFQFILSSTTEEESAALCLPSADEINVGLARVCATGVFMETALKPDRFRLSPTQVLYNWQTDFQAFSYLEVGECFVIHITVYVDGIPQHFCSNCFEKIGDPCYTSVIEYGNDEDAFGFKYCTGGGMDEEAVTCEPTIITFANVATLSIPYTAQLQAKYGNLPNIQTWLYDPNGVLTNMGIQATFNTYPPTQINWDFGGIGSGVIILR